ncbi:hypothetical protein PVL29_000279 [Vitis rotundifolia]|uniref:Uncharacterized protein n=1 Tax=Vitis rotundifolia TaxID=103349 RepID=A0AA39AIA3_VITRO|nr:hypothetical protein PVL29_000279 [Vitis rotundifolia]
MSLAKVFHHFTQAKRGEELGKWEESKSKQISLTLLSRRPRPKPPLAHLPGHHSYHPPETGINSLPQFHQSDPALTTQNNAVGYWSTGLFDCMDDPNIALTTAIFPCVTFGQIADVLDNGHTTCATSGIIYAFAACLLSWPYRRKLRQRFGLTEAPASDCMVHCLFEPCALCQEYRELKNRGINPALGYLAT